MTAEVVGRGADILEWRRHPDELPVAGRHTVDRLVDEVLSIREVLVGQITSAICHRVPEFVEDQVLAGELEDLAGATVSAYCGALRDPMTPIDAYVPMRAVSIGRTLALRKHPLPVLIEAYRVGQTKFFQDFVSGLTTSAADAQALAAVMPYCSERFNRLIDAGLERSIEAYRLECDRLKGRALTNRLRTVQAVLDGTLRDEAKASTALGHDLRAYQTALVIWSDLANPPDDLEARMDVLASVLARALGAEHSLAIPASSGSTWAWMASAQAPKPPALVGVDQRAEALGLRVASGGSRRGIGGFVATHHEAVWASTLARRGSRSAAVTTYGAVAALSLLHADQEQTRAFVHAELGGLAGSEESTDRLRETVRIVLEEGFNARLAAERLFAHRNTILYRLRRAEQLRGCPLQERKFELELALKLVDLLGDWALPTRTS